LNRNTHTVSAVFTCFFSKVVFYRPHFPSIP